MMKYLCLFVALLVFVPTSYALQCWSRFCERGSFCIETCSSNLTSCVASYHRTENGATTPTYFACSTTSRGLCLQSECTPSPNAGNIYSCCCRGDLCNAVPGITPGTLTPPTVPPVPEGVCVCVWGLQGNKKQNKNKGPVGYSSVLPQVSDLKHIYFYLIASECSPHIGA